MSEVQARSQAPASRGRGGGRGGRGGYAGRNESRTANPRRTNGEKSTLSDPVDEDGDIGQLRQQYGDKVDTVKAVFPDWSDADILYALQETEGDVEVVVDRIMDGKPLTCIIAPAFALDRMSHHPGTCNKLIPPLNHRHHLAMGRSFEAQEDHQAQDQGRRPLDWFHRIVWYRQTCSWRQGR